MARAKTPKPTTEDDAPAVTPKTIETTVPEVDTPALEAKTETDDAPALITPADPDAPVSVPEPVEAESNEAESPEEPVTASVEAEQITEPSEEPEKIVSESVAPVVAPTPAPQKSGGFGGMVLGGVIAAALGAGAAIYALPNLPQSLRDKIVPASSPSEAVTALESALAAQTAKVDSLTSEFAALKSAVPPAADLSGVTAALDEANAQVRAVRDAQTALEGRLDTLEKRPTEGGGVSEGALAAFQRDLDALKAQIAENGGLASVTQAEIEAAAAQAQAQIKAAEDQAAQLRAQSEAAAQRTMAQAAVARLGAALDSGAPLAPAIADLQAAGLALPTAITDQVPSLTALQSSFPDAARAGLAAARRSEASGTLGERVGAFLLAQTGARSLEPQEGSDPDAVLSRAQAAVDAGDIGRAVTELAALPETGQAAMADWVQAAKLRLGALDALGTLAQSVQ